MHDTIEFEKRGIPATVIITQAFRNAAVFQFKGKGMDGHPYIELPHPISNLKPDEMKELTLRFVDQAVKQITA
ncbi:MAG: hypothetical protein K2X06_14355 [Burkholderiales bacterium]|nr:hypothetical protein [Burkholderiales bacterium]